MTELDIDLHLKAFANAFVLPDRRSRWRYFLVGRPKQLYANSAKLYDHVDRSFLVEGKDVLSLESQRSKGVFLDFNEAPSIRTLKEAIDLAGDSDALFSIDPGKLAVYFFHEGERLVFRR